jgi:hypothetical protein
VASFAIRPPAFDGFHVSLIVSGNRDRTNCFPLIKLAEADPNHPKSTPLDENLQTDYNSSYSSVA